MANIVPNVGLNRAAQVILDNVSHTAVGSGTTAPAVGDTTLVTETDRLAPSNSLRSSNELQLRTFFPNANLPTTVEEAGWFMNGSGTVDSGELLVRSTLTFAKGSNDMYLVMKMDVNRG